MFYGSDTKDTSMSAVTAASSTRTMIARRMRARRLTDQIGRILLALVLTVTAVVYIIVPFLALKWLATPFPGVFVEYPNNVNGTTSAVGNHWTGWDDGLKSGDLILEYDGQPVQNPQQI